MMLNELMIDQHVVVVEFFPIPPERVWRVRSAHMQFAMLWRIFSYFSLKTEKQQDGYARGKKIARVFTSFRVALRSSKSLLFPCCSVHRERLQSRVEFLTASFTTPTSQQLKDPRKKVKAFRIQTLRVIIKLNFPGKFKSTSRSNLSIFIEEHLGVMRKSISGQSCACDGKEAIIVLNLVYIGLGRETKESSKTTECSRKLHVGDSATPLLIR